MVNFRFNNGKLLPNLFCLVRRFYWDCNDPTQQYQLSLNSNNCRVCMRLTRICNVDVLQYIYRRSSADMMKLNASVDYICDVKLYICVYSLKCFALQRIYGLFNSLGSRTIISFRTRMTDVEVFSIKRRLKKKPTQDMVWVNKSYDSSPKSF